MFEISHADLAPLSGTGFHALRTLRPASSQCLSTGRLP
jgi:hypothetical protein